MSVVQICDDTKDNVIGQWNDCAKRDFEQSNMASKESLPMHKGFRQFRNRKKSTVLPQVRFPGFDKILADCIVL